jgi:hypothetical protein
MVTDHEVPKGKPVSVKVTAYVSTLVKVISSVTFAPLTEKVPEVGEASYNWTGPTENPYWPLGNEKRITEDVEESVMLGGERNAADDVEEVELPDSSTVTDQLVPEGKPLSSKEAR